MPLITRLSYPSRKPPKTATRVANTRLVVKRTVSLADDSIADVALARSGAFGAICIGMWEVGEGWTSQLELSLSMRNYKAGARQELRG